MLEEFVIALYSLLHGEQDPIYEDKIYLTVAVTMLLCSLVLGICFYYCLNGLRAKFSKTWPYWWTFMIANVVFNFIAVIVIAHFTPPAEIFSAATLLLGLINGLYSGIVFFLLSLLLKVASPHARHTPF